MSTSGISGQLTDGRAWLRALPYALPAAVLVLGLFYYWFAVADRYVVFLYNHDVGPRFPDTSPFSALTGSRYWMAGLVAAGAVMVSYVALNWLLGRFLSAGKLPAWWRVWALCAVPLLVGIPLVVMTVNRPVLPPLNVAQVASATLCGLALALVPGRMAAERPGEFILLALDGLALMLLLLSLPALESVARWLAQGSTWYVWALVGALLVGVLGLLALTGLRLWRRWAMPSLSALLAAGACAAYLLMPLLHHLFFTDGYYYISCSTNFFAWDIAFQVVTWLAVAAIALGVTWLRRRLADENLARQPLDFAAFGGSARGTVRDPFVSAVRNTEGVLGGTGTVPPSGGCGGQEPPADAPQ